MMIYKSGDGTDASGQVTFFPTAFGYEYKCTIDDYNGRGPKWSTIRTIKGIKFWFRNVLFEFGAKEVTIGKEHWDIDDFPKDDMEESLNETLITFEDRCNWINEYGKELQFIIENVMNKFNVYADKQEDEKQGNFCERICEIMKQETDNLNNVQKRIK